MTAATYNEAITRVLKSEGGYVNNPRDPGGPTNYGVTLAVYRQNGHPNATAADVRAMSLDEAKRIYKLRYATPVHYDEDPAGLDYTLLDYAVNSGTGRANKVVRRVCGLPDNAAWPALFDALAKRDTKSVISAVNAERLKFLQSLSTWPTFGKGWGVRVRSVNDCSLHMADVPISEVRPSAPATPTDDAPQGNGEAPKPDITKPAGGGTVAGGTVSATTWWDWIVAHPFLSIVIGILALATIIVIAELAARAWQSRKQNAVMPIIPVPELGAKP